MRGVTTRIIVWLRGFHLPHLPQVRLHRNAIIAAVLVLLVGGVVALAVANVGNITALVGGMTQRAEGPGQTPAPTAQPGQQPPQSPQQSPQVVQVNFDKFTLEIVVKSEGVQVAVSTPSATPAATATGTPRPTPSPTPTLASTVVPTAPTTPTPGTITFAPGERSKTIPVDTTGWSAWIVIPKASYVIDPLGCVDVAYRDHPDTIDVVCGGRPTTLSVEDQNVRIRSRLGAITVTIRIM